jgi:uncharacterized Zn finger protein
MAVETKHFIFNLPTVKYAGATRLDRDTFPRTAVGLVDVTVGCKSCAHVWMAKHDEPDGFHPRADGALLFRCPECSESEEVELTRFF